MKMAAPKPPVLATNLELLMRAVTDPQMTIAAPYPFWGDQLSLNVLWDTDSWQEPIRYTAAPYALA
jgi:hypothetical protein